MNLRSINVLNNINNNNNFILVTEALISKPTTSAKITHHAGTEHKYLQTASEAALCTKQQPALLTV